MKLCFYFFVGPPFLPFLECIHGLTSILHSSSPCKKGGGEARAAAAVKIGEAKLPYLGYRYTETGNLISRIKIIEKPRKSLVVEWHSEALCCCLTKGFQKEAALLLFIVRGSDLRP